MKEDGGHMDREEWERVLKARNEGKVKEGEEMPAVSKKMRKAMAIAEHHPEKLFKRNKGMLKMSKNQLSDFASTKEKGLPTRAKGPKPGDKFRSGGKGRGLAIGKGKGPIGVPVGMKREGMNKPASKMKKIAKTESIGQFMKRRNKETKKKW